MASPKTLENDGPHSRCSGSPVATSNGAGAVEFLRVCPGRLVALALLGHALDEDGAVVGLGRLEGLDERLDVVAVDRADVADAELLEDEPGEEDLLGQLLEGPAGLDHGLGRAGGPS